MSPLAVWNFISIQITFIIPTRGKCWYFTYKVRKLSLEKLGEGAGLDMKQELRNIHVWFRYFEKHRGLFLKMLVTKIMLLTKIRLAFFHPHL